MACGSGGGGRYVTSTSSDTDINRKDANYSQSKKNSKIKKLFLLRGRHYQKIEFRPLTFFFLKAHIKFNNLTNFQNF
jgi:hypothetical protein